MPFCASPFAPVQNVMVIHERARAKHAQFEALLLRVSKITSAFGFFNTNKYRTSPEDMASFEVLHTQNHSSGSFPSGDFSFLPEVSGSVPNGSVNHYNNDNFDLTNMQSTLASAMHDSSVEVYSKLLELMEENNSLKEKLNINNSMMKEQMSTITAWREHMISSRDEHQQNLQSAREKISDLEKENAELQQKIESLRVKENDKNKVQSCTKCTLFENFLNHAAAIDAEETESAFLGISYFRENIYQNLVTLCHHVEALSNSKIDEEERQMLKTYVLLLKFKIASLEGGNLLTSVKTDEESGYEVVYQKISQNELQLRHDLEHLTKILKLKDSELDSLKKEKEELCEKIKAYEQKVQEWEITLKSQFELMNSKLEMETSLSEKYKERVENLQQQIEEYQVKFDRAKVSDNVIVKELREEVQNLQEILKLEQRANQNDKEKVSEVLLKCEELQVDYDRVTKLLEIQSKDEKEKNKELNILRESDAKEYLEKIDQLTAQLFEMEEQMRESNAEIRKLQDELAESKDAGESIPILKAQIQVYKTDFDNVELAKNAASEEVERLTNELKKYEKKCDSCPCSCNKSQASGGHRSGRSSMEQKDQHNEDVACPFCGETFKNERHAQRHIDRCHTSDDQ